MYTLKQIPEDFIVEEIPLRDFSTERNEKSRYDIYLLTKTNYNTEDAVQEVCRHLNIPRKNMGYAGAKDRNAVTSQYVSIIGGGRELQLKDISLLRKGYADSPISLGDLKGNHFKITVRNLEKDEIHRIEANKNLSAFVNYFDSQRFSDNNADIGKLILNKKYKEACQILISENSRISQEISAFLEKHANAYLNALKLVSKKTLLIYVHAYQSLLWNKAVEEAISAGLSVEEFPILGFGTELEGKIKEIYDRILISENITLRDFILRDFPEMSLEGAARKIMMAISNLHMGNFEADELNADKKKITVTFYLEKGAYATMAVKNIVGMQ